MKSIYAIEELLNGAWKIVCYETDIYPTKSSANVGKKNLEKDGLKVRVREYVPAPEKDSVQQSAAFTKRGQGRKVNK